MHISATSCILCCSIHNSWVFFLRKFWFCSALTWLNYKKFKKIKKSNLFVSSGRPSLLTLRGMAAPLSSLSAERVFPTELPRLMARLGVWGCGEAVSDCWGLLDVLCHLLLLLRKGNLYSNEPLSLLLPLYSEADVRYNSEQPLRTSVWVRTRYLWRGWHFALLPLLGRSRLPNNTHIFFCAPTLAVPARGGIIMGWNDDNAHAHSGPQ